jgi:hypothetical protein
MGAASAGVSRSLTLTLKVCTTEEDAVGGLDKRVAPLRLRLVLRCIE